MQPPHLLRGCQSSLQVCAQLSQAPLMLLLQSGPHTASLVTRCLLCCSLHSSGQRLSRSTCLDDAVSQLLVLVPADACARHLHTLLE